jgi:hypothetical protein
LNIHFFHNFITEIDNKLDAQELWDDLNENGDEQSDANRPRINDFRPRIAQSSIGRESSIEDIEFSSDVVITTDYLQGSGTI